MGRTTCHHLIRLFVEAMYQLIGKEKQIQQIQHAWKDRDDQNLHENI